MPGLICNGRKIINRENQVDKSYLFISLIGFPVILSYPMNTYQPYFDGTGERTNNHAWPNFLQV